MQKTMTEFCNDSNSPNIVEEKIAIEFGKSNLVNLGQVTVRTFSKPDYTKSGHSVSNKLVVP